MKLSLISQERKEKQQIQKWNRPTRTVKVKGRNESWICTSQKKEGSVTVSRSVGFTQQETNCYELRWGNYWKFIAFF